jgi:hypothetical protein
MTWKEFEKLVKDIDPANFDYIMRNNDILEEYGRLNRWTNKKDKFINSLLEEYNDKDLDKSRVEMVETIHNRLEKMIREFDGIYLTPVNAKVGDGATVNLWSDRYAGTIAKVTKATITIRRDKAIKDPNFKPEFIPGGFVAHCTNQSEQAYTYEPDENGNLTTIYWSKKYNRYGTPGNLTASKGRHEFYDYNF